MIKIEITGNQRTVNLKDGRSFPVQEAYAVLPNAKYPSRCEIAPPKGAQPYSAGIYTLSPDSFYVDRFGSLTLSPKLLPVAGAK